MPMTDILLDRPRVRTIVQKKCWKSGNRKSGNPDSFFFLLVFSILEVSQKKKLRDGPRALFKPRRTGAEKNYVWYFPNFRMCRQSEKMADETQKVKETQKAIPSSPMESTEREFKIDKYARCVMLPAFVKGSGQPSSTEWKVVHCRQAPISR